MKKFVFNLMLGMTTWVCYSCEKELTVEGTSEPDTALSIVTRSVTAEEVVTYPVAVYVLSSDTKRLATSSMLTNKDSPLELGLAHGTYDVFAIAGADEDIYKLPQEDELSETSELVLKDGKEHTDLMTAHSTVTLKEKEENTLVLGFERQVMQLKEATILQVPSDITNVSISLSPFYQSLQINGVLGNISPHQFPLVSKGDGTWTLESPQMVLISPETAAITVSLQKGEETVKSYTFPCPDELKKNYQISIVGTYQEDNTVHITGNMTGVSWAGTHEITFTFGEGAPTGDDNGGGDSPVSDEVPKCNSIYKDCYVLSVQEVNGGHEVILLYKEDFTIAPANKAMEEVLEEINAINTALSINGITGWRLPNEKEAEEIVKQANYIISAFKDHDGSPLDEHDFYLCECENSLKTWIAWEGVLPTSYTRGQRFRPVATIQFKN